MVVHQSVAPATVYEGLVSYHVADCYNKQPTEYTCTMVHADDALSVITVVLCKFSDLYSIIITPDIRSNILPF